MGMKNYDIERFLKAQEFSYETALQEIRRGRKRTHWMWYIFPQLGQLGQSQMSKYYGMENLEEAEEYLAHPILGDRLRRICEALLRLDANDSYKVMGGIDGLKLHSSMTLFAEADGYDSVFGKVLEKYFNGKRDEKTVSLLQEREVK